jgi:hypothetical protein
MGYFLTLLTKNDNIQGAGKLGKNDKTQGGMLTALICHKPKMQIKLRN